jgi:hypothetical protein
MLQAASNVNAQINNPGKTFDKKLETLLDQKDYFRLETELKAVNGSIDDKQKKYFQCFLDNAFNRNDEAIANIDNILQKYSSGLPDSLKAALLLLQADSYYKRFQYAKAAINDSIILSNFITSIDTSLIADIKNDLLMRKALQDIPPQETIVNNETILHWKKDGMGLVEIPVRFSKEDYNCVVDTKANLSCITESYASKLGLKILDVSIDEGSLITGINFKSSLGVADSLYIGNILVKNAVFLVMPDATLRFPPFSIHIIIGFPIIEQLGEIEFYKDGRMTIPASPSESDLHNFALDGLIPILSLQAGNDTLCFDLDLGATNTVLYSTYFEKYKETILRDGKQKNIKLGGAGGSRKKEVYTIPVINLSIQNKTASIRKVDILTQKTSPHERSYGNLGQDFTGKLDGFILNFKSMYFKAM